MPLEHEHLYGACDEIHRAPAQVQQRPADGIGEALGIVGQAAHQIADGHAVIVGKRELLELLEAELPDGVRHAYFDPSAQAQERPDDEHLNSQQTHIERDKRTQTRSALTGDVVIDGIGVHQREQHVHEG